MQLRLRRAAPVAVMLAQPRRLQTRQRQPGPRRRRHPAVRSRRPRPGQRPHRRHRRKARGRRVRRVDRGRARRPLEPSPNASCGSSTTRSSSATGRCPSGPAWAWRWPSPTIADITADDLFTRADLAMYSAKRDQFSGVRTSPTACASTPPKSCYPSIGQDRPAGRHRADRVARRPAPRDRRATARPWSINRSSTWRPDRAGSRH